LSAVILFAVQEVSLGGDQDLLFRFVPHRAELYLAHDEFRAVG
jgi:hypothetical protein